MARPRQRILWAGDSRAPVRRGAHGFSADEIAFLKSDGCHLCRRTDRALSIDHSHKLGCHPGKTGCRRCSRGAICQPCQLVLRYLDDDVATAERIPAYLRRVG